MATPRGTPAISPPLDADLARILSSLGDANMQTRGTSLTKLDVVFASITLKAGDTVREVPHGLGRVPTRAVLWELVAGPSGDSAVAIASVQNSSWTPSTIRIRVAPVGAGSIDGAILTLLLT